MLWLCSQSTFHGVHEGHTCTKLDALAGVTWPTVWLFNFGAPTLTISDLPWLHIMHHRPCASMHVHAVNNLPWPCSQLWLDAMTHHNYVTVVCTFTILLVSSVFTNCHGFYLFILCMTSTALSHQSFHPQLPPYSTQYLWAWWPCTIESPALNVSLLDCASSMCHDCESLQPWTTHHCLMCHCLMIVCIDRQCPDHAHPQFTRLAATACLWVTMTTDHMSHLT